MESRKVFTRAMLQEECGIVEVNDFTFTRDVYKEKAKKRVITVTQPSLRFDLTKDKQIARYVNAVVSLYNYKTKKYVSMPYSKLRYVWEYGSCPIDVEIDHIDTNPLNNRLDNLRAVSLSTNQSNRKNWKPFLVEEIKGKSVKDVCNMIAQRIEEYKDNPYKTIYKKTEHTQAFLDKQNALIKKKWQDKLQKKRDKIYSKINALEKKINDLYDDCYHKPEYIAEKVLKLRNKKKDLKNQLTNLV